MPGEGKLAAAAAGEPRGLPGRAEAPEAVKRGRGAGASALRRQGPRGRAARPSGPALAREDAIASPSQRLGSSVPRLC